MRTGFVIPLDEIADFTTHCVVLSWHHDSSHAFVLHRTDKSFNHSNAAVLTDGVVELRELRAVQLTSPWVPFDAF
jgi:hypothetical protein